MNREEFINELRIALSGNVSASQVNSNVDYYQQYFDMQMKKGMMEEEIIDALGSPRLLAKSIINAQNGRQEERNNSEQQSSHKTRSTHIPIWLSKVIIILIVVLFIALLFSFTLIAIKVFLPIILVVFVIGLIVKIFRG